MHAAARAFVASVVSLRPKGPVLEIGSHNINGTIRDLFNGTPYLGLDVAVGPGVDVIADGATYVPDFVPACVVCCEVLEHAKNAEDICRHAHRLLMGGGLFIVTAAGEGRAPHSAIDGGPIRPGEYYRNIWTDDLKAWLSDFEDVRISTNPGAGDIYALAFKRAA